MGQKTFLLPASTLALALKLFCQILGSRAEEWFNQKQDYTRQLDEEQLNRQSLSMDYEYLEDTNVQELRARALARSFYGIRGWLLLQTKDFFRGILSVLTAVVIILPMITQEDSITQTGIFSLWPSLLLIIIALVWGNYKT